MTAPVVSFPARARDRAAAGGDPRPSASSAKSAVAFPSISTLQHANTRRSQPDLYGASRIRIAWPPPGASTIRNRVAEVTGRFEIATGSGLSSQLAPGPSA